MTQYKLWTLVKIACKSLIIFLITTMILTTSHPQFCHYQLLAWCHYLHLMCYCANVLCFQGKKTFQGFLATEIMWPDSTWVFSGKKCSVQRQSSWLKEAATNFIETRQWSDPSLLTRLCTHMEVISKRCCNLCKKRNVIQDLIVYSGHVKLAAHGPHGPIHDTVQPTSPMMNQHIMWPDSSLYIWYVKRFFSYIFI